MNRYSQTVISALVLAIAIAMSPQCYAEKDPKAAARQAQIDADQAAAEIERLQNEQVAAETVQDETSTSMSRLDGKLNAAEQKLVDAEKRRQAAEDAE